MDTNADQRWRDFARIWAVCHDGAKAARQAGYSTSNARQQAQRLLRRDYVRAEIDRLERKMCDKVRLSGSAILRKVKTLARKAETAKDFNAALRAYQMLGDRLKLWEPDAAKEGKPLKVHITYTDERSDVGKDSNKAGAAADGKRTSKDAERVKADNGL